MGDSRWGDLLDVITDDASLDVLSTYQALVILGPVPITDALRERLAKYVTDGGRLVWASGVASPDEEMLVGASIQPELRVGRAWQWRKEEPEQEAFRYCPAILDETNGLSVEVLAKTRSGEPLVLAHCIGKGMVYTCLLPWFEAGNTPMATLGLRLLDEVIKPLQPVLVEGPPVAWASSHSDTAHYVAIANHDDAEWTGRITVRNVDETYDSCQDIVCGKPVAYHREAANALVKLTIAPYGTSVLQWKKQEKHGD